MLQIADGWIAALGQTILGVASLMILARGSYEMRPKGGNMVAGIITLIVGAAFMALAVLMPFMQAKLQTEIPNPGTSRTPVTGAPTDATAG